MPLIADIADSASILTRAKLYSAQRSIRSMHEKIIKYILILLEPLPMVGIDALLGLIDQRLKITTADLYKHGAQSIYKKIFNQGLIKFPVGIAEVSAAEILKTKIHVAPWFNENEKLALAEDFRNPSLSETDAKQKIALLKRNELRQQLETIEGCLLFLHLSLPLLLAGKLMFDLYNKNAISFLTYSLPSFNVYLLLITEFLKNTTLKIFRGKQDKSYLPYFGQSLAELFPQTGAFFYTVNCGDDVLISLSNVEKIRLFSVILGSNLKKIGFEPLVANAKELVVRHLGAKKSPDQHQRDFQRFKEQSRELIQQSQALSENIECFKKSFLPVIKAYLANPQFKFIYHLDTESVTASISLQVQKNAKPALTNFFEKFELLEQESEQIILDIKNSSINWSQEAKNFESYQTNLELLTQNIETFKRSAFKPYFEKIDYAFSYCVKDLNRSAVAEVKIQFNENTPRHVKDFFYSALGAKNSKQANEVIFKINATKQWNALYRKIKKDEEQTVQSKQQNRDSTFDWSATSSSTASEKTDATPTKKPKIKTRPVATALPNWMISIAEDEEIVSTTEIQKLAAKKPIRVEINSKAMDVKEKYFKPLVNKDGITTQTTLFFHPATRKEIKKTDAMLCKKFKGLWAQPKTCAPQGENGFKKFIEGRKVWEAKLIGVDARVEGEEKIATVTYNDGSQSKVEVICFDTFVPKAHR